MGCFSYTCLTFLLLSMHTAPGTGAFMLKPLDHPGAMAFPAVKVDGYDDAFRIIDDCAVSGEPTEELFDAVRFVDKNAYKIYPDLDNKQALWKEAHGSWKLQFASSTRMRIRYILTSITSRHCGKRLTDLGSCSLPLAGVNTQHLRRFPSLPTP